MAEVEFDPGQLEPEVIRELADVLAGPDGLAWESIKRSHDELRGYSDEYDVESIIDSLEVPRDGPTFQPDERQVNLQWEWTHRAADFFNAGTSDHTVDGDPVLSFIYDDAPAEVRDMFPHTERVDGDPRVFFPDTDVRGIAEIRYREEGVEWLQRELARRFS